MGIMGCHVCMMEDTLPTDLGELHESYPGDKSVLYLGTCCCLCLTFLSFYVFIVRIMGPVEFALFWSDSSMCVVCLSVCLNEDQWTIMESGIVSSSQSNLE